MSRPSRTVELDVRPYLEKKLEPFKLIMDTVKQLQQDELFVLHATIRPTPLLTLMKTKGYVHEVTKLDSNHWKVLFAHKSNKHFLALPDEQEEIKVKAKPTGEPGAGLSPRMHELDNRGLEPPQPMVRTLKKLEDAAVGDTVIIHNDRVPVFLIEELGRLGYSYQVEEQEDGTAKISIQKS